nr:glycosyltransferase family 4 protein [Shewanella submarina]
MPTKYVLGPVGGGENVPLPYLKDFSIKGKAQIYFRYAYQKLQKINPIFIANCHFADSILARTPESRNLIPSCYHSKTELCLETGTPEELLSRSDNRLSKFDVLTIVTVGRLIPTKVNILTLRAIRRFKQLYGRPFKFIIVGEGPERNLLESYCSKYDLDEVEFLGWQKREKVFELVSKSDIYFSTTFKEGGTWAFFEAVALEIPIVCLKLCGPDIIVPDDGGVKIPPQEVDITAQLLAEGLLDLAYDPSKRKALSANALSHIKNTLSWNSIVDKTIIKYEEVMK